MTTELLRRESGDALAYELEIAAPPELVWRFWVDPARLVRWMGDVATLEPRPGGTFRLEYRSGDIARGECVEVDEPRRLVLTWGWEADGDPTPPGSSRIEVDLEPSDGGAATRLRLRHSGLPFESRAGHDEGWAHFLARLAEAAGSLQAEA
jgi:uncharacterized protein YndB with AHSA1/START domain